MRLAAALCSIVVATLEIFMAGPVAARDLDWRPKNTWAFVVGVLNWKHVEYFGSFPVKNRRDAALVDFLKERGVPARQIVYLQDKAATQQRIDEAFTDQMGKVGPGDLLIIYYAGHGTKAEDGNDVYLASYDAGDDGVQGWSINSIPRKLRSSRPGKVLWFIDCCYSGQAALAIAKESAGRAYACVTSSAASESSTAHWTFTEALLDAFRGESYVDLNHDGAITLAEFGAHVEADMNAAEEQRSTFASSKGFDPGFVLAHASKPADPRIGERAQARDNHGDWYACRVVEARDHLLKIHFIGYEPDEDALVKPEELRPISPVRYATGTKVEVSWKKQWYPATVLQAKDGAHLIHYTGYEAKWDEWVPSRRIRIPKL